MSTLCCSVSRRCFSFRSFSSAVLETRQSLSRSLLRRSLSSLFREEVVESITNTDHKNYSLSRQRRKGRETHEKLVMPKIRATNHLRHDVVTIETCMK